MTDKKRIFHVGPNSDAGKQNPRPGVDVLEEFGPTVSFTRFRYVPWKVAERAVRSNDCRASLESQGYAWHRHISDDWPV